MCSIETGCDAVEAEVIGFRGHRTILMSLDAGAQMSPGARVMPIGGEPAIAVGDELLGRAIDGRGRAIDGRPQPAPSARWPLRGAARSPLDHERVAEPLDVGVRAINGALTVGRGAARGHCRRVRRREVRSARHDRALY